MGWVLHPDHNAFHACFNHLGSTGRGFPIMRAGFQIEVKDGSSGFLPCLSKRDNLCVSLSCFGMVPFSDHFALSSPERHPPWDWAKSFPFPSLQDGELVSSIFRRPSQFQTTTLLKFKCQFSHVNRSEAGMPETFRI